jgi:DNA repair protein RecO (recombination protein O)
MPRPPRVYKTPGIVLRQRRLGDTDKIITLYTAEFGKLDAVAKGVRRVRSRLAGHVEPLNHGSYLIARGRNLDIITQAQTIETFQILRDDLGRLSHAFYAAELLDRATEERADNFALYRLLLDTLRRLTESGGLALALRFFEMALLDQLGYRPEVDECVVCRRLLGEEACLWAPGLGGAVCSSCQPRDIVLRALSPNALRVLRLLQGGGYAAVAQLEIAADLSAELERHLREAVHYGLDRDVRSAAFLDIVRRPPRIRPAGASSR